MTLLHLLTVFEIGRFWGYKDSNWAAICALQQYNGTQTP